MKDNAIHFLLTPDGPSSRRVRRALARQAPGLYRMAGSWPELMAQAHAAYLLPPDNNTWAEKLAECAAHYTDAFWADNFAVAPSETLAELDTALMRLVEGAGSDGDWSTLLSRLPENSRCHTRLSQLHRLLKSIGTLPYPLQQMADLLAADQMSLRLVRVYRVPGFPELNRWQEAVLSKLDDDAPALDSDLQIILNESLSPKPPKSSSLSAARSLFQAGASPARPDSSLRVLAVRDRLAEVEAAAGIIQKALSQGNQISDFGILLPQDEFAVQSAETVFQHCGLPLSGLEHSIRQRDLGIETVRLMLLCLRKPAPIMSIAALLTSPLLPWPLVEGHDFAQAVMDGDVLLKNYQLDKDPKRLMTMIDQGADTPADLRRHLTEFKRLLESNEDLPEHRARALVCIDGLQKAIAGMADMKWEPLMSAARPEHLRQPADRVYWQEGIAVFHEGREPWQTVKHLVVLGFNEGHFPAHAGASAVLTEAEWEMVDANGWPVATAEKTRQWHRDRFARQLSVATDSITFMFSRRDNAGDSMEPSSSLVFLARRFGMEPEEMVLELERQSDREKVPELAFAPEGQPVAPRHLPVADMQLDTDLLEAFGREPGELAPLSPSAADTLMVSPFAWLLGRLGCNPRQWGPDALDPMTAGTLAHGVFETLFPAGDSLIDVDEIRQQAPAVLRQLTLQLTPFLRSPDWKVERLRLETEIVQASIRWRELLDSWGARVMATEQWLRGQYDAIPIRGQSDLLLELPSGKLLVVDYKKASSGSRRDRMRNRFDLQAHMYRLMIQTGGLPALESTPDDIGVVYYLMNDQTALSDCHIAETKNTPGLEILDADTSSQALNYLDRRIGEVRAGRVRLNTTGDEDWWQKNASIKIYALDNSPLLRLFMHEGEETS